MSHAFVHPHPDFVRPDVPLPPRKIQGTLLRSVAATSPKLAGRINRPVSMATGIDVPHGNNGSRSHSPLSSSGVPSGPTEKVGGARTEKTGGMRSENLALLEANLKKLEKTGKLHQWNKRLNSVVRRSPTPKKPFSFSRFARPSSFRRKKSPLVGEDTPYSDNELEVGSLLSFSSTSSSPNTPRPQKPPRTYVTRMSDVEEGRRREEEDTERLFPHDDESFSSDLLNTFEKIGSMYNMSSIADDPAHDPNEVGVSSLSPQQPKRMSIQRSLSAMGAIDVPPLSPNPAPPAIAVTSSTPSPPPPSLLQSLTPVKELSLMRNLSYSDTSLEVHCSEREEEREALILEDETDKINEDETNDRDSQPEEAKEMSVRIHVQQTHPKDAGAGEETLQNNVGTLNEDMFNTELPPPPPRRQWEDNEEALSDLQEEPDESRDEEDLASLSSQDSFQSAMESTCDDPRPESVASELFHTPPRSLSPDEGDTPPDLEAAVDHTVSMGLSLGIHVTLGNKAEVGGASDEGTRPRNESTVTVTDENGDYDTMRTLTRKKKTDAGEGMGKEEEEEELDIETSHEEEMGKDDVKVGGVNGNMGGANEGEVEGDDDASNDVGALEEEVVMIPENMTPTKVSLITCKCTCSRYLNRVVDALVMTQLKIDRFKMTAL